MSPSTLSVAVAPSSVYVESILTSIGLLPVIVITGFVVSTTFTFLVLLATLPACILLLYKRLYSYLFLMYLHRIL